MLHILYMGVSLRFIRSTYTMGVSRLRPWKSAD